MAVSWTATALCADIASHKIGPQQLNLIRMGLSLVFLSAFLLIVTLSGIAISILAKNTDGETRLPRLKLKLPVKGILFGIGAGVGQGAGLVLSKTGLQHYADALPAGTPDSVIFAMPFAGTFIRAIFGFIGFFILLSLRKELGAAAAALKNRSGMKFALMATFFGPFIGVSLSLMAVEYANAGIASTLMALTPVLIIVPYSLINKQKIKLQEVVGTIVTVIGVAMFFML